MIHTPTVLYGPVNLVTAARIRLLVHARDTIINGRADLAQRYQDALHQFHDPNSSDTTVRTAAEQLGDVLAEATDAAGGWKATP